MRTQQRPIYIFALNLTVNPEVELRYIKVDISRDVRKVEGCYKGIKERSYVVPVGSVIDEDAFHHILHIREQESILFVDNEGQAHLLSNKDGYEWGEHTVHLGRFHSVDKDVAINSDCYTYDGANDRYFITG